MVNYIIVDTSIDVGGAETFNDFFGLVELAIFLASEYSPSVAMCMEPSSQLFSEYGIGEIDWI